MLARTRGAEREGNAEAGARCRSHSCIQLGQEVLAGPERNEVFNCFSQRWVLLLHKYLVQI